jgi:hypothetical protein
MAIKTQYLVTTLFDDTGDYIAVKSIKESLPPIRRLQYEEVLSVPHYRPDTIQMIQELVLEIYGEPKEQRAARQPVSLGYAPMYTEKNRHSPPSVSLSSSASSSPHRPDIDPILPHVSESPEDIHQLATTLAAAGDDTIDVNQYKEALDAALVLLNNAHKTKPTTTKEVFDAYVDHIRRLTSPEKINVLQNNITLIPKIIKNKEFRNMLLTALETKMFYMESKFKNNEESLLVPIQEAIRNTRNQNSTYSLKNALDRHKVYTDISKNFDVSKKLLKKSMRKFGSKLLSASRDEGRILPRIPKYIDFLAESHTKNNQEPILPMGWQVTAKVPGGEGTFLFERIVNLFYLVQNVDICFGRSGRLMLSSEGPDFVWYDNFKCDPAATRFIVHSLTLITPPDTVHRNIVLVDTHKKTMERFEPHGTRKQRLPVVDHIIQSNFEKLYKDHQWTYYAPVDYMPYQLTLQTSDKLCTIWPYLYILLRVQFPEMPRDKLLLMMERDIRDDQSYIYKFHHYLTLNLQSCISKATGDTGQLCFRNQANIESADRSYFTGMPTVIKFYDERHARLKRRASPNSENAKRKPTLSPDDKRDSNNYKNENTK